MTLTPQSQQVKNSPRPPPTVALINASDDTVEMVKRMLATTGAHCLITCHLTDLKRGYIDFTAYLRMHNPAAVVFDISPPYDENWEFFKTMRDSGAMERRGIVLTTTNKARLDEIIGKDSTAIEIVGKPYDLQQINAAINAAIDKVQASER